FVLVTFYALLFVFFSSSRDPLHLPSFPTRRSSDLGSGPGPYLILPFFEPMTVRDGIGKGVDGAMNPLSYVLPFFWAGIGMKAGEDRKSTRLNSSHQIISYAVFCLKKKTYTRKKGTC